MIPNNSAHHNLVAQVRNSAATLGFPPLCVPTYYEACFLIAWVFIYSRSLSNHHHGKKSSPVSLLYPARTPLLSCLCQEFPFQNRPDLREDHHCLHLLLQCSSLRRPPRPVGPTANLLSWFVPSVSDSSHRTSKSSLLRHTTFGHVWLHLCTGCPPLTTSSSKESMVLPLRASL